MDSTNKYNLVPLTDLEKSMINLTRRVVGGRVTRFNVLFKNGTELKGVKVINESMMELPREYNESDIKSTSVPFEQY